MCELLCRLLFVTARNDHMPEVFAMVHVKKLSPVPASILLVRPLLIHVDIVFRTIVNQF